MKLHYVGVFVKIKFVVQSTTLRLHLLDGFLLGKVISF